MSSAIPNQTYADELYGGPGGRRTPHKRDASALAALHAGLRTGLANLNRRLSSDGAEVVAYSTWFDDGLGKDVIVLLWRTPPAAVVRDDAAVRRYMEATDEELALIDSAFIAHQLLGPGRANERPKGVDWIEVDRHA